MKVTEPVGVPLAGTATFTVAVNVTGRPNTAGLMEEATTVVVGPGATVSVSAGEVLGATFPSPLYSALRGCAATVRPLTVSFACPAAFSTIVLSIVGPSRKVTVPVGVPVAGATTLTVAVTTNGWPMTDGFGTAVTVVALAARTMAWGNTVDTLPLKLVLPAYRAVIE